MSGQTLVKAFVTLPGGAQAVYTGSGLDHYRHSDWLGSARVASSTSRTVLGTVAYAPFGETYASSGTVDACYTGQNQDTTGGDYDFLAREYSNEGRWSAPDPAGMSAVDPSSPQSWNRYAYVTNTPMSLVDPLGLCDVEIDGDCGSFVPSDPPQGPVISTIIGAGPLTNLPGISGLGGRPKPPAPPPGYDQCKAALLAAHKDFDAVERAQADASIITAAASANGIDPNLLAAIGVRESGWNNLPEKGGGAGAGIFQIDLGAHRSQANIAYNPPLAANYAAFLLSSNYNYFESRYSLDTETLTAYAVHGYNAWNKGQISPLAQGTAPLGIYGSLDYGTARGNYVSNVFGLRDCFGF